MEGNMIEQEPYVDSIAYNPPICLWHLVEQHVASHEQDEVKSMLGVSLVEETLELHSELSTLLDIWRDCREKSNLRQCQTSHYRLPEPPGVRERLIQEIAFFIENIKEKNDEFMGDGAHLVKSSNQKVLDYAINAEHSTNSCEPPSRPLTAMGRDGRETPFFRQNSPSSDRMSSSTYSTLSEDVDAMADKLNVLKVDEVIQHLRSYLAEEREFLVQDIKFLQECIEDENESFEKFENQQPEPSIAELREERLKLEKALLSDVFLTQNPVKKLLTSSPPLKPANIKNRQSVIPKTGPIKAVHDTAPDGVVLSGDVPDSVVTKAQRKLIEESRSYKRKGKLDNQKNLASSNDSSSYTHALQAEPKTSVSRPSSALRFRSMVMNSRALGEQS